MAVPSESQRILDVALARTKKCVSLHFDIWTHELFCLGGQ